MIVPWLLTHNACFLFMNFSTVCSCSSIQNRHLKLVEFFRLQLIIQYPAVIELNDGITLRFLFRILFSTNSHDPTC